MPQLRPRTVLVGAAGGGHALVPLAGTVGGAQATVGETLGDLMAARGWPGAPAWARRADRIAPTIVGGSKKHGGADLGPTRAKQAWAALGVDGLGLADEAPGPGRRGDAPAPADLRDGNQAAGLAGRVGLAVQRPQDGQVPADRQRVPAPGGRGGRVPPSAAPSSTRARRGRSGGRPVAHVQDPVFRVLRSRADFLTARQIAELAAGLSAGAGLSQAAVLGAAAPTSARTVELEAGRLGQDFELEVADSGDGPAYRLGGFKAFLGQPEHARHERFAARRTTIS